MNIEYDIICTDNPDKAASSAIVQGIAGHNELHAGDHRYQRVCLFLRAPDETILGGVLGAIYWDWFHIDLLWIREDLRGRGHGRRLLARAEEEARQRGAQHVFLDTFSFQAPEFYKKYGYTVFGELKDYPPGHQRYFFTKQL
jgi:ribosomal protein S18 acetylase RimI-like enzyme